MKIEFYFWLLTFTITLILFSIPSHNLSSSASVINSVPTIISIKTYSSYTNYTSNVLSTYFIGAATIYIQVNVSDSNGFNDIQNDGNVKIKIALWNTTDETDFTRFGNWTNATFEFGSGSSALYITSFNMSTNDANRLAPLYYRVKVQVSDGIDSTISNMSAEQNADYTFAISPVCGDAICNSGESCSTCSSDCGVCPSSGGSSNVGSGGGGAPATTEESLVSASSFVDKVEPNSPTSFPIAQSDAIGIKELQLTTNILVKNAEIKVAQLSDKPTTITASSGKIYKYLEITKNIHDSDIKEVKIKFSVKRSWLNQNSVGENEILIQRYTTVWEELPTKIINASSNEVDYEASSPGFSVFAIIAKEKPQLDVPLASIIQARQETIVAPIVTDCPTCQEPSNWSNCIAGIQTRIKYYCNKKTNYLCIRTEESRGCKVEKVSEPEPSIEITGEAVVLPIGLIGSILNIAVLIALILITSKTLSYLYRRSKK